LPTKRLSMRKLKEVLRLRFELGLGQRQIARSCSIGHGTVYEYLKRAQAAISFRPVSAKGNSKVPASKRLYQIAQPSRSQ
jgi:predicted DNA-binding protein (UPF0251 family)